MWNQYKKNSEDYSKYDACVKIASFEIGSENKIRASIVTTLFKDTVAGCFYRILPTNFWKKCFRGHLREN